MSPSRYLQQHTRRRCLSGATQHGMHTRICVGTVRCGSAAGVRRALELVELVAERVLHSHAINGCTGASCVALAAYAERAWYVFDAVALLTLALGGVGRDADEKGMRCTPRLGFLPLSSLVPLPRLARSSRGRVIETRLRRG